MNKTWLIGIATIILVGGAAYFVFQGDKCDGVKCAGDIETYSNTELGFSFDYPTGDSGYQLIERSYPEDENVRKVIILMRNEDAGNIPVGGEGPPTITMLVVANPQKDKPRAWADRHTQYSNVNLERGDINETTLGGANAIRYMAGGLYVSDNVIAAHGDNVYVLSGMFIDEDSAIRRDFGALLQSVRFIPAPGQL